MSNDGHSENGDAIIGAIIGIIAAILFGLLAVAIINALSKPKCPNCGNFVDRNSPYCQKCHTVLRWQ